MAQVGRPEPGPVAVFVVFDSFAACVLEEDPHRKPPPCMRAVCDAGGRRRSPGGLPALTIDDIDVGGAGGPAAVVLEDDDDATLAHDEGV